MNPKQSTGNQSARCGGRRPPGSWNVISPIFHQKVKWVVSSWDQSCWPGKCSDLEKHKLTWETQTQTEKLKLTWLHRSGRWALCAGVHWSGYKPAQSRYWFLRRKQRQKINMREVRVWLPASRSITAAVMAAVAVAVMAVACHSDTWVCFLSLQLIKAVTNSASSSAAGKRQSWTWGWLKLTTDLTEKKKTLCFIKVFTLQKSQS